MTYKLGDKFVEKNTRDAPVLTITDIAYMPYGTEYTLQSFWGYEIKCTQENLETNYTPHITT